MKNLIFTISFCLLTTILFGQGGLGPSNVIIPKDNPPAGVIDGIYEKKDLLAKKRTIPFEHVRENDVTWERRTWSYIDLRERINYPLYYPHEILDTLTGEIISSSQGRYSLFYILKTALQKGQLMGYFDTRLPDLNKGEFITRTGGDGFTMPASRDYSMNVENDMNYQKDISEMVGSVIEGKVEDKYAINPTNNLNQVVYHIKGTKDTKANKVYGAKNRDDATKLDPLTETFDPSKAEKDATGNPATVSFKINFTTFRQPKTISKYLLKEDWIFDKERSILDVRIIGLAPVIQTDSTEKVLFWVYFPHARDILKNYYAYQPETSIGSDFDELFLMRKFNSVVYKASSLQDRKIEETRFGIESLYESEKVKNEIRVLEHDVWNF